MDDKKVKRTGRREFSGTLLSKLGYTSPDAEFLHVDPAIPVDRASTYSDALLTGIAPNTYDLTLPREQATNGRVVFQMSEDQPTTLAVFAEALPNLSETLEVTVILEKPENEANPLFRMSIRRR